MKYYIIYHRCCAGTHKERGMDGLRPLTEDTSLLPQKNLKEILKIYELPFISSWLRKHRGCSRLPFHFLPSYESKVEDITLYNSTKLYITLLNIHYKNCNWFEGNVNFCIH